MYSPDMKKQRICDVGKRMYDKSLVIANDGNISWRIDDDAVLVTPSRVCKADLTPDMILTVDMQGNIVDGHGIVSTEVKLHLAVYRCLPDAVAAVHAHPLYATAYAVAGIPLEEIIYPTAYSFLGAVPVAPYGTASTDEVSASVEPLLRAGHRAILLANHGALTHAGSLWDAYYLMERLEAYASISYAARQLGGGRALDGAEKERLEAKIRRQKNANLL